MLKRMIIIAVVVLGMPHLLQAQDGDPALLAQLRNDCRLAAQILTTGHPDPHRLWAIEFIARCEGEGPVMLGSLWRTSSSGEELEPMVESSLQIRDARLYRQLRETAADRSRPAAVRAAAMLVLTRYANTRNALWLTALVPPDSIGEIPLIFGSGTPLRQATGEAPLTAPIAASILSLLDQISADRNRESRTVWYAAAVLAKRLRLDIANGEAY